MRYRLRRFEIAFTLGRKAILKDAIKRLIDTGHNLVKVARITISQIAVFIYSHELGWKYMHIGQKEKQKEHSSELQSHIFENRVCVLTLLIMK